MSTTLYGSLIVNSINKFSEHCCQTRASLPIYVLLITFPMKTFWDIEYLKDGILFCRFLAHLTQRVRWAIAITWRPSSSSVVRRNLFQKSSPLKVLDQWKPNLVWIITRVSSFKIVSGDAVHQPTWPLLLKIEHMVKLQVLGNNSKTFNNIKNLIWCKNDQHIKIYIPCNFEVNLNTHLGVIALFSSNL